MGGLLNKFKSLLIKKLLKILIKDEKELKELLDDIKKDKKDKKKKINLGYSDDNLFIAKRMIDNAKNGILVDLKGKIIKDFNIDMNRMQKVFNDVERKRVTKKKEGAIKHIQISANDIKAVLFKPIVKLPLEHENLITSNSILRVVWSFTKISLNEELQDLTKEKINSAFINVLNHITSFEDNILSKLKDNDYTDFINIINEEIPTSFGRPSIT